MEVRDVHAGEGVCMEVREVCTEVREVCTQGRVLAG